MAISDSEKFVPFVHLLLGASVNHSRVTASFDQFVWYDMPDSSVQFGMEFGGGIDYSLGGPWIVRGQADSMGMYSPATDYTSDFRMKGLPLSVGLSLRLGKQQ